MVLANIQTAFGEFILLLAVVEYRFFNPRAEMVSA